MGETKIDTEVDLARMAEALTAILKLLQPLTEERRWRVLKSVAILCEVKLPGRHAGAQDDCG